MDSFVGQICMFPWNWTPKGWLPCDGKELGIQDNQVLFSLIGTMFGGDGRTTFKLPKIDPLKAEGGGDVRYFICVEGTYPSRP